MSVHLFYFGVLTNVLLGIIIPEKFGWGNSMAAKYEVGQKVIVTPVKNQHLSPRDSNIEAYAGRNGKVTDYYWMNTGRGEAFYIYTVWIEDIHQDVVLHEDEIQAYIE